MDDGLSNAVREVFVRLYDDNLIYRGKRLVNWDPVFHTAISDLEVENKEEQGSLWHFRYPLADGATTAEGKAYIVVATTRPETILGDTAVAVNPDDERYQSLVGKFVDLPLLGRRIPIVADDYVDSEFGSGCVKITPAHDFNDYEVGKRHGATLVNVLDQDAKILHAAEAYTYDGKPIDDFDGALPQGYGGLDRFDARKKIIADFDALGLLDSIKDHSLMVPRGDRSDAVIEPWLTDQWYVTEIYTLSLHDALPISSNGKTPTSPGCAIFRTGVFRASCGGATKFPPGTTRTVTFTLVAAKPRCAASTTSMPT